MMQHENNGSHRFKKSFGQNFLTKEIWPKTIVEYLNPDISKSIIEVGPGHGILTQHLINSKSNVYSVEIDTELIPYLQNKFSKFENFHLVNQDILQVDIQESAGNKPYQVVGSLPYNISKKIIRMFLTAINPPTNMVFIIQKEVADDYASKAPRSKFLSVFGNSYSDVILHDIIPARDFYPTPAVDGAIIEFANIKPKFPDHIEFMKFVKGGFLQPRKKLSANLSSQGYDKKEVETELVKLSMTETARSSELTLDLWYKLFQSISKQK